MKKIHSVPGVFLVVLLLVGCGNAPKTGPENVRWDREQCVRCLMSVSDHSFSAQVRGGPAGKKSKVHFFDDIGCAVLWLDEQVWRDDPATEIWVTDHTDQSWIDARKSFYTEGHITPMDFGLGAQVTEMPGALNFEMAIQHIREREQQAH